MSITAPVPVSYALLGAIGMEMFVYYRDRIPQHGDGVIVVSNHRSFMDAPVLIKALNRPVRIACHHYMGQTPLLREFVHLLGCFPLAEPQERSKTFLHQATKMLQSRQWVGIFPEGASPMVRLTPPDEVGKFERGFAHLALKVQVPNLAVLPVAIAPFEEEVSSGIPLRFLRLFDPTEPLFDQANLHPVVIYRRAKVLIGRPYWISSKQRQDYQGKGAKKAATALNNYCREEIVKLLHQGLQEV